MSQPTGVAYRSLAWALSGEIRRTVIDKTGLTGTFDVHLRWERDPQSAPGVRKADAGLGGVLPAAPSLFDAVQEQLGLKLEAGRAPVEHLVVDHVERPTAN